jgi:hypothetical protein
MPDLLFRFRSLRGDARKYVERSINNNELFFAAPDDLNDPYDCQIALDMSGTDLEWRTHLKNSLKQAASRSGRRTSFMDRHRAASKLILDKRHIGLDGGEFRKVTNSFGIACFSGLIDNQLMWSHYADNHRGICLMYMPSRDPSGLLSAFHEVHYSNEYPKIRLVDLPKIGPSVVESLLLTKSKEWQYEFEYRIIKPYGARKSFNYHPNALAAVILGARISQDDEKEVVSWARAHPSKPLVHRAELQFGKFGVEIDFKKSF